VASEAREGVIGVWGSRILAVGFLAICLGGCATTAPTTIRLDAVVIDDNRAAEAGELALVTVQRGAARLPTEPGMTLEKGDRVTTGPGATAVIRWPSGSVAHLHPNSRARIGSLFELVGEVFVRVRGRFVLETEFVIVGAEGTSYLVRAVPSGEAEVLVLDGRVTVSSLLRAWAPVRLAPGEKTVTEDRAPARLPDGKPPPPSPVRPPVKIRARPDELEKRRR
jgi:ferric-dicitrate binding protein FerR (iron transport regulator)